MSPTATTVKLASPPAAWAGSPRIKIKPFSNRALTMAAIYPLFLNYVNTNYGDVKDDEQPGTGLIIRGTLPERL
jgi:hypothetical protein